MVNAESFGMQKAHPSYERVRRRGKNRVTSGEKEKSYAGCGEFWYVVDYGALPPDTPYRAQSKDPHNLLDSSLLET